GAVTWLALGKAPAYAQKRELTFLSWNHFVPAADDELRKQAEAFSKAAGVSVRVDTIAHLQLMAKFAAEAQSQSGHDMIARTTPFGFCSRVSSTTSETSSTSWASNRAAGIRSRRKRVRRSRAGVRCRGSGSHSPRRTTWRTSRRRGSSIRSRGTSF